MKKKLIETNELSKDTKDNLLKRSLIGIGLILVLIPCVIFGGYLYFAVIVLLVLASIYEILKTPQHKFAWFIWLVAYITIIALVFWVMLKSQLAVQFKNFDINFAFNQIWISPIALAVMIGLYFFFVVIYANFSIQDAFYLISLSILVALGYQALLFIRYIPFTYFKAINVDTSTNVFMYGQSMFLIFYMIVAIFMNDIGAYITGILIGKHKINPRISPKKTWEGFFGGIFFSIAFSLMFALIVAHFGLPMLPNFDVTHWYWILLCSAILPIIGNLGDFAFSSIKRHYNIKDYSNVLGPHGGVLDRFDSSLFGAIALSILVIFISNGWNFYL